MAYVLQLCGPPAITSSTGFAIPLFHFCSWDEETKGAKRGIAPERGAKTNSPLGDAPVAKLSIDLLIAAIPFFNKSLARPDPPTTKKC
jgi:hypothetical protein